MGWVEPRTWVVGEMVIHTVLNVQVRDNLIFIGTSHNHASAGATAGSPALGALNVVSFSNTIEPGGFTLRRRGGDPLKWNDNTLTWIINGSNATTTAALVRVGTIEATTGGTIAADGTHNHVV